MCAGPHAHVLLGIDDVESGQLQSALLRKAALLRPGLVRVALPYHLPAETLQFVLRAVEWVADHGVHFLSQYIPVPTTGEWSHISQAAAGRPRRWLHAIQLRQGGFSFQSNRRPWHDFVREVRPEVADRVKGAEGAAVGAAVPEDIEREMFGKYFDEALAGAWVGSRAMGEAGSPERAELDAVYSDEALGFWDEATRGLRWFVRPSDCQGDVRPSVPEGGAASPTRMGPKEAGPLTGPGTQVTSSVCCIQ